MKFAIVIFTHYVSLVGAATSTVYLADKSPVIGKQENAGNGLPVQEFWGIPFAEPPVGSLRFRRPVPAKSWNTPRNCFTKPNACMQEPDMLYGDRFEGTNMWNPNTRVSEDCLYLNIWVPGNSIQGSNFNGDQTSLLPVLIWIYGGGFSSGSSALAVYNGGILATEQDVIVVSMNYRLNIFGFFSLDSGDMRGNQGLLDQRLAMLWVKKHIAQFGGDPDNVTLFGESAGAGSIGLHTVSPLSAHLFKGAILESGSAVAPWALRSNHEIKESSLAVAQGLNCYETSEEFPFDFKDVLRCMQDIDAHRLLQEVSKHVAEGFIEIPFGPAFDGYFVTEQPENSLKAGKLNCEHIMIGANENEGNYFLMYYIPEYYSRDMIFATDQVLTSDESLNSSIKGVMPKFAKAHEISFTLIYHEYVDWSSNIFTPYTRQNSIDKIAGDYFFTCPVLEQANLSACAGKNVYLYKFDHASSVLPWPRWLGAMHGYELMYIFGEPLDYRKGYSMEEKALSKLWMTYVGNFARTGDPNRLPDGSTMLQFWPKYNIEDKQLLVLSITPHVASGLRTKQCYFWNEYLPSVLQAIGRRTNEEYDTCYERAQQELEDWANNAYSCNGGADQC